MVGIPEASAKTVDKHLPSILKNEATGILADLICQPALAGSAMFLTESDGNKIIDYIIQIFETCRREGSLKFIVSESEGALFGYSMFFESPAPHMSCYCHKIYVFDQYRGMGFGSQIFAATLQQRPKIRLLCRHELVPFYEKLSLEYQGEFTPPSSEEGFAHTRGMYGGLAVMASPNAGPGPVFMLNDDDIKNIRALIVGR
ncbi:GNAT family N-acetyltransferase [Pseudomonas monteilii]|uniref:GNAT family N-acetyltransferase n=1 Tax=Pseudomonas monteilii TaxID=76759 RepID=UPI0038096548